MENCRLAIEENSQSFRRNNYLSLNNACQQLRFINSACMRLIYGRQALEIPLWISHLEAVKPPWEHNVGALACMLESIRFTVV